MSKPDNDFAKRVSDRIAAIQKASKQEVELLDFTEQEASDDWGRRISGRLGLATLDAQREREEAIAQNEAESQARTEELLAEVERHKEELLKRLGR